MVMVFITVNQNGNIGLWLDEPQRNDKRGKWEGKYYYLNSIALDKAKSFVKETNMTWESDPVALKL